MPATLIPPPPGSSPRLWGTHPSPEAIKHARRFIPTAVGNAEEADA